MTKELNTEYTSIDRLWVGRICGVIVPIWIFVCAIVLFAYCFWSLDRGLDITDESYYLLAAIYPNEVSLWATAMHWFSSGLWQVSGSLVGFRVIGLGILAVSALIFALGTIRAFEISGLGVAGRNTSRILVMISTVVGALLYDSFVPFTPSYNLLADSAIYIAMGLVLVSSGQAFGLPFYVLKLIAGAALGVAFLCKFSAGFAAFGIVSTIAVVFGYSFRERAVGVFLIAIASVTTIWLSTIINTTVGEALDEFRLGAIVYMLGANENLTSRLVRYFNEELNFLQLVLTTFSIPLLSFLVYAVWRRPFIVWVGMVFFCYILITDGYLLGGMDRYELQAAPLLTVVMLSLVASAKVWLRHWKASVLVVTLLGLPFCVAIGTYNPIHVQILFSLAPWGTLTGILAFLVSKPDYQREPAILVSAFFITIVTAQVVTNGLRAPYRLNRPLTEQTEMITVGQIGTLRIDRETRDSYIEFERIKDQCGITPEHPFLGLYNIPGVALILQVVPVATPLLQDRRSAEAVLNHVGPEIIRSAVIGIDLDSGSDDPSPPKQLRSFPGGYRLCGTVTIPYRHQEVQLWIPEPMSTR